MTSPTASGPAGTNFEVQVGAYYLLTLLAVSEPRGLPGTSTLRVKFQRANEGHPLDDIIVHAQDPEEKDKVLAIQAGLSITFAPSDEKFEKTVGQIAETLKRPDFWDSNYDLGIAVAKSNTNIHPYQDVLTWARKIGDSETFHNRFKLGTANKKMRQFINTIKTHLLKAGAPNDDVTIWKLLGRLHILDFDFTAPSSASEERAVGLAKDSLHQDDTSQARILWENLSSLTLQCAANGGDYTPDTLAKELRGRGFRLRGDRRNFSARAGIAEASRLALKDIENSVGAIVLMRHNIIARVRAAFNQGRYIEIRGDAGVGKSGILRYFAEQMAAEAPVVVLSPNRTTPRGWAAMRAEYEFDGEAHELLGDFAANGNGVLFIDNLDFFNEEKQPTVRDLVRAAAKVPDFRVIITARQEFGNDDEPNWLLSDVLEQLGRSPPVIIDELDEEDIEELRNSAPRLSPLLDDTHPARIILRNLFRLAQLAKQTSDQSIPHTEIDMAKRWWESGDGKKGGGRERKIVLRKLAERALSGDDAVDNTKHLSKAIDELVDIRTLRDLPNGKITFGHNVFREWAIANLLFNDPTKVNQLLLSHPASPSLARGIGLAGRMSLALAPGNDNWSSFLTNFCRDEVHKSWRRAILLALVNAENGTELLGLAKSYLFTEKASLLRELIRIMQSAEVYPIVKASLDLSNLYVPRGAGWLRLIAWLLEIDEDLPTIAIHDVVKFYIKFLTGYSGFSNLNPLTSKMQSKLYHWLNKIEAEREVGGHHLYKLFNRELSFDELDLLESILRRGFLLFCQLTPDLAVQYLKSLQVRRNNDIAVRDTLKMCDALVQVVPEEFAEFTAAVLIKKQESEEHWYHYPLKEAFGLIDLQFFPPSPNQGPFLKLLNHAPQYGLPLIRQLVDHAVSFYNPSNTHANNEIVIPFSEGARKFPWPETYMWSRKLGARDYCVTSGLMALKAWAHSRIEEEKSFDKVLQDVLGPPYAPAAYLLIVVDLLLSHWPKSCESAIPFLACPELLCIDRRSLVYNSEEPNSLANLDSLRKCSSRKVALDSLLKYYAISGSDESREKLTKLLQQAEIRLGPPSRHSDLGNPAFMVVQAMNLINPVNLQKEISTEDDPLTWDFRYIPPQSEVEHFKYIYESRQNEFMDYNMEKELHRALDSPSHSSPDFAVKAVTWAQDAEARANSANLYEERRRRENAIYIAAMIAARDGDTELRLQHINWICNTFTRATQTNDILDREINPILRFNPVAIAFIGMIHLLKERKTSNDIRIILKVAALDSVAAAYGLGVAAETLAIVDERFPRAVLRCALTARIQPSRGRTEKSKEKAEREHQRRIHRSINNEIKWLEDKKKEPEWPEFPIESARPKHRLFKLEKRNPYGKPSQEYRRPDGYVEHEGAALWIKNVASLYDVAKRPWLNDILKNYCAWTIEANGGKLGQDEKLDWPPKEWNAAYYELAAYCLPGLEPTRINELIINPILSFPNHSFFKILTLFLRVVDKVYFSDCGLQETQAVYIRSTLAEKMQAMQGWRKLSCDWKQRNYGIEVDITPAIAVLFFNDYDNGGAKCYLLKKDLNRLAPFLPTLRKLIEDCPHPFIALLTLNLLEVSPSPTHLTLIVWAAKVWIASYPNDSTFWIDYDNLGRRLCIWIETVLKHDPDILGKNVELRSDMEYLLADLVSIGIPEACLLEGTLSKTTSV